MVSASDALRYKYRVIQVISELQLQYETVHFGANVGYLLIHLHKAIYLFAVSGEKKDRWDYFSPKRNKEKAFAEIKKDVVLTLFSNVVDSAVTPVPTVAPSITASDETDKKPGPNDFKQCNPPLLLPESSMDFVHSKMFNFVDQLLLLLLLLKRF